MSQFKTTQFLQRRQHWAGAFSLSVIFILSLVFFQNCSKSDSTPAAASAPNSASGNSFVAKGSRELGIDMLALTPASDFTSNLKLAKSAGATYLILGLGWNQIEASTPADCASAGTFTDPGNALSSFNTLLPAEGMKLSLSIVPISTNLNLMPSNLKALNFDDPLVVCRFQKMLSFVFSKIPNLQLVSMQFGNEIDSYSTANQISFWAQYWSFFVQASNTAKQLRPGLKTSIVSTLYGANGHSSNVLAQGGLQQIYNSSDIVALTYYPLNDNFTIKNISEIQSDINSIVSLYPSKPIYFNEIGLPSGASYVASSDTIQKQFISQVFKVWDQYANQITKLSFLRLNDLSLSAAQATAVTYSLPGNNQFIEYIQTLGLRTYTGSDKPAFVQLKTETSNRSW